MLIYYNGRLLPPDQARIPFDDAGFQHSVGLFETMLAHRGQVFRLQAHLHRLQQSARELGLAPQLDLPALANAVAQTLSANNLPNARVRLTLTPGSLSLLSAGKKNPPVQEPVPQTVLVVATPPTEYDPAYFQRGITVLVAPPAANPFDPTVGHKTLNYWHRLRTLRQAATVGAGEAIWLNLTQHLASGAVSNVFLVKAGQLLTPIAHGEETAGSLPAPVLPGVTRAAILELAGSLNIPIEKRMLAISDLLEADEVFLTNSSWLLLPVTKVEKKTIADGQVGPITRRLRTALLEQVEKECSAPSATA
ncbi:MAG: aminotransferase class IV family protein [Phycisphaeraceae bacterium]|nr:aminotransferase class IV family protein [Phycisphaeraceae bacterium]